MTLFDWLFKDPAALHRQTTAPLYNERLAFLTHMKERDRKYNTLRAMATHLLHINRTLGFSNEMRVLTMEELRSAGRAWPSTPVLCEGEFQADGLMRCTCG